MSELWFVGLGLEDERDLSERALAALSACDRLFAEQYTASLAPASLDRLARRLGRPVESLDREAVEGGERIVAALAEHRRVALLVVGDPFVATTHVALRVAVETAGHDWRYLPNASVLTAAPGFLGLQSYRFGRTVSLPFPSPGFAPTSPIDGIAANRREGLHTLVLLDLRPSEGRFLGAGEAIALLAERDPEGRATADDRDLAVLARVGTESARAWFGPRVRLTALDFGPPMHCLIVPAEPLHFQEEEAVRRWRVPTRGPP